MHRGRGGTQCRECTARGQSSTGVAAVGRSCSGVQSEVGEGGRGGGSSPYSALSYALTASNRCPSASTGLFGTL